MKSLFQKITKSTDTKCIAVVSGLPRSGTSMMMKMLEAGGTPPMTDKIRAADDDNPKGYYEFERVKQMDKGDTAWVPEARGKVVKVISALLKYLPSSEQYRIIFVRRNMSEILASQRKMLVNRGEDPDKQDDAQMSMLFEKHLNQVESFLASQPNMQTLYLHYSDILTDPQTQASKIISFLGLELNEEAMTEAVDPKLYRNRQPA
jgi:hypothetical protein